MLACGGFHTAVVTAKGELYTFGRGDSGQLGHGETYNALFPLQVIAIQQKVTKIACGVDHTICCTGVITPR
jgi:E3 ubiquitin-protein ligase HERC2